MRYALAALLGLTVAAFAGFEASDSYTFAIIGDRTGFTQTGVYQHVWRDVDKARPAFAINVGDSIQGYDDAKTLDEWGEISPLLKRRLPFYLVPGNHDIFSPASARAWKRVTGREPSYSFDYRDTHITVLDNSLSNDLSPAQLGFLEKDLAAHKSAAVKLVFFHRPFWLFRIMLNDSAFPFHALVKKYGVTAVVSGHVHSFGYWKVDGVQYLMAGSSGGQLRSDRFSDGWFFGWVEARVDGGHLTFTVHEQPAPDGEGRNFLASDWTSVR